MQSRFYILKNVKMQQNIIMYNLETTPISLVFNFNNIVSVFFENK